MLQKASQEGIICGLDWFMAIHHRRLRSYAFMPSLAGQQSVMPKERARACVIDYFLLGVRTRPRCLWTCLLCV